MRIPDLSDIPELTTVPEDEYRLKIVKAKDTKSQRTGREGLMLMLKVLLVDADNALPIFHTLWFPMDDDDDAKHIVMWRMIKEFMEGIGMDSSAGASAKDFEGIEFNAMVTLSEDNEGRPRNELGRIV